MLKIAMLELHIRFFQISQIYALGTLKLEHFQTTFTSCWVCQGDFVESLTALKAAGVFVSDYFSKNKMTVAKYFTPRVIQEKRFWRYYSRKSSKNSDATSFFYYRKEEKMCKTSLYVLEPATNVVTTLPRRNHFMEENKVQRSS